MSLRARSRIEIADRAQHPLTAVFNTDESLGQRPRLVSLPPKEAVQFCMASDMGDPTLIGRQLLTDHLMFIDGWWICVNYKAKERTS